MDPALKKQIVSAVIGLSVGILGTYAMVWRDVAVIKESLKLEAVEMSHIKNDISVIQMFISNDDPRAYIAAKAKISEDHEHDKQ